jgi:hypothetical protein
VSLRQEGLLRKSALDVLRRALHGWSEALGDLSTEPLRKAFEAALQQAEGWRLPAALPTARGVAVVFGGGPKPLWQRLVDAWPLGEPLREWCICSRFWPEPSDGETPFEAIARGLEERGASFVDVRLRIITCADSPGERGRPKFPFRLIHRLPVRQGYIAAARLDALIDEIPEGTEEGRRELHAKWILLRGPSTAVILLGSANFTRKGLGVAQPEKRNIEACVLLTLPPAAADPQTWMPPLAQEGIVDLAACQETQLKEPTPEDDGGCAWPDFIARIEVEVRWQDGPEPVGSVRVVFRPESEHLSFTLSLVPEIPGPPAMPLLSVIAKAGQNGSSISAPLEAQALRWVLTSRAVQVSWKDPTVSVCFPVNIDQQSKEGLPSVLGARPDEQQLLAYFHGRVSEEDLVELLQRQAAQGLTGRQAPTPQESERFRQLQSYLVRDFVESLFGLTDTLRQSMRSPRAFAQALVGEFSPVSLAEQVLNAFRAGRRSPTAAAFQFVELIRVVAELPLEGKETLSKGEREALDEVRARGLARLMALAGSAGERGDFRQACRDGDFSRYVLASLLPPLAEQWASAILKNTPPAGETPTTLPAESALS